MNFIPTELALRRFGILSSIEAKRETVLENTVLEKITNCKRSLKEFINRQPNQAFRDLINTDEMIYKIHDVHLDLIDSAGLKSYNGARIEKIYYKLAFLEMVDMGCFDYSQTTSFKGYQCVFEESFPHI